MEEVDKTLTIEKKRKEILKVLDYRDGEYYIGSMQMCALSTMLGIKGYTGDVPMEIERTDGGTINKVYRRLVKEIEYMRKNPMKKCWWCGSVVPRISFLRRISNRL